MMEVKFTVLLLLLLLLLLFSLSLSLSLSSLYILAEALDETISVTLTTQEDKFHTLHDLSTLHDISSDFKTLLVSIFCI